MYVFNQPIQLMRIKIRQIWTNVIQIERRCVDRESKSYDNWQGKCIVLNRPLKLIHSVCSTLSLKLNLFDLGKFKLLQSKLTTSIWNYGSKDETLWNMIVIKWNWLKLVLCSNQFIEIRINMIQIELFT